MPPIRVGFLVMAALGALSVSAAFQLPGLSPDGVLSDASRISALAPWRGDDLAAASASEIDSDYVRYFAPYASFLRETLRAGVLPLWNPYLGTGVPVLEALQPALLHPTTLLLLVLPAEDALTVLAVLRLAVAGLGTLLLARILGARPPAATLAAALFMLGPFHLTFRFHTLANVSVLLPWLLLVSELARRGASSRRAGAAWALLVALASLGGHAQTTVHVVGAAGLWHLLRAGIPARPECARGTRLASATTFLAGATALGGLAALVAVWGHGALVLETWAAGFRRLRGVYPHLLPPHLASLLAPHGFAGVHVSGYLGTLALVLAVGGLAARRSRLPAWPLVTLGGLALAAAHALWPVGPLLGAVPIIGLGDHSRLLLVAHLALALLAARGLETLDDARVRRTAGAAVVLTALALAVLWANGRLPPGRPVAATTLVVVAAAVAAGGARIAAGRAGGWLVVALCVLDLYQAFGPRPRSVPARYPAPPPLIRTLAARGPTERALIPHAVLPTNVPMMYRVATPSAFEPALDRRSVQLLRRAGLEPQFHLGVVAPPTIVPGALRVLTLLGVRHLVLPVPIANASGLRLREIAREPLAVYENAAAFPRAFAVAVARCMRGPRAALAALTDPGVDLRRTVILEPPCVSDRASHPSARPAATLRAYAPGRLRIAVDAPVAGHVVVTEAFMPGWQAAVDGRPTAPRRANYALLAVPVPAGAREVVLTYRPLTVRLGGPVSALVLAGLLVALVVPRRRRGQST